MTEHKRGATWLGSSAKDTDQVGCEPCAVVLVCGAEGGEATGAWLSDRIGYRAVFVPIVVVALIAAAATFAPPITPTSGAQPRRS